MWQFVLFSEFIFDIPSTEPTLPSSLNGIKRASPDKKSFINKICDNLRNDSNNQEIYIEKANGIENSLKLKLHCSYLDDLGEKDTFAFEDKTFLTRSIKDVLNDNFETSRKIISAREKSVWRQFNEETSSISFKHSLISLSPKWPSISIKK